MNWPFRFVYHNLSEKSRRSLKETEYDTQFLCLCACSLAERQEGEVWLQETSLGSPSYPGCVLLNEDLLTLVSE